MGVGQALKVNTDSISQQVRYFSLLVLSPATLLSQSYLVDLSYVSINDLMRLLVKLTPVLVLSSVLLSVYLFGRLVRSKKYNFSSETSVMAAQHDHLLSVIRRMEDTLENTLRQLKKEQVLKMRHWFKRY